MGKQYFFKGGDTHHHTYVEMVDPTVQPAAEFLNEVQKEAEDRILSAAVMAIPRIDAKLIRYDRYRSAEAFGQQHHIAFKINDEKFNVVLEEQPDYSQHNRDYDTIKKMCDQISREILMQVVRTPGFSLQDM